MDGKCLKSLAIVAVMIFLVAAPPIQVEAAKQACCPNVAARACYAPCSPFVIKETCAIFCDCLIRDKGQCPPDHSW
ncbi:hypothetical protein SEVIR_4G197501v4 [Setaria viridis]|uniref:Uncharacterized protein n=1 Tax=Setaria viridis TaxID=4556 RepID=A0A4U6UWE1_SETVI|nr:hypothetical protein SEVIR_4G197501v2 [Setaria viridis]